MESGRTIRLLQGSCLGMSSAGQAGKSGRRVAAAVRAPCREPPCGNAEDAGQPIDLLSGESPLPTVAVAFGSAHGGGCGPAHQLAEHRLRPPFAQAQGPDVRADNSELLRWDLVDPAAPSGRHVLTCQTAL